MPFETCYPVVLKAEAGEDLAEAWEPAPKDDSPTFCGINRAYNKTWAGWAIIDANLKAGVDPKTWTQDQELMDLVKAFYYALWTSLCLDQILTATLQASIFGGVFNDGPRVVGMLQYVLGVPVDEDLGPGTLAAIAKEENAGHGQAVTDQLNLKRIQHYATTAKPEYVRGLVLRVFNGA